MKYVSVLSLLFMVLLFAPRSSAQPYGRGEGMGKIEQLEKIKLLEILNLDEETSVKFLVRRKEFRAKQRFIQERLDSLMDEMHRTLKSGKDQNLLPKMNDEYLKISGSLLRSRMDFFTSLSDILTPEQQSKMILFERKFKEELQEMMFKNRRGQFRNRNNED